MLQHPDCTVVNNRLEAYADGQVSPLEETMISAHIERCSVCAAENERALEVKKILQGLPQFEGPESMPKLDQVRHSARLQNVRRWQVMLALAAGVLITFILFPYIGKTIFNKPKEAQVEQSVQEAKYAFALVAKFSHRAGLLPGNADDSRGRLIPKLQHTNDRLRHYLGEVPKSRIFKNIRSLK